MADADQLWMALEANRQHIDVVRSFLAKAIAELERRVQDFGIDIRILIGHIAVVLQKKAMEHDKSKLISPEAEIFAEYRPRLYSSTYGSPEYVEFTRLLKPALDHHYAENRHHPEHFADGIIGMNLIDLIEMICDWKAASLRHENGNIRRSLEINQGRFGYSASLSRIFGNTVDFLEGKTDGLPALRPADRRERPLAEKTLIDLVETLVYWRVLLEPGYSGGLGEFIVESQSRIGFDNEIRRILLNTVEFLETSGAAPR